MPVLSGKVGQVEIGSSPLFDFTDGDLEYGSEPQEYFARSGAGASETVAGAESGSGSFNVNFNSDNLFDALVSSGDLVTLNFVHTTTGTVQATGQARIGKISRNLNRDGSVQSLGVSFVTHKAWTFPS